MTKEELRLEMRRKRRGMTDEETDEKSEEIYKKLFSLECVTNASEVCTFLSAFREPDTLRIIKNLHEKNQRVAVPVTDTENVSLSLSYIEKTDELKKGAYGIYEPSVINPADKSRFDVILVPGLAFDRKGARLGFGKGYYDRLLENGGAVKIGLCYDFQLFEKIPSKPHDVPMDIIVTNKEILKVR